MEFTEGSENPAKTEEGKQVLWELANRELPCSDLFIDEGRKSRRGREREKIIESLIRKGYINIYYHNRIQFLRLSTSGMREVKDVIAPKVLKDLRKNLKA